VLSEFDGRNWTVSPVNHTATPQYSGSPDSIVSYTVMLQPHRQRWLFALDAAASLPTSFHAAAGNTEAQSAPMRVLGRLMSDGQMIASKPVSQVLRYRQSSVLSDAVTPAQYPDAISLFLPGENSKTIAFASELRESSSSNQEYAKRVLQNFNTQEFFYTLSPQFLGDTPVDEFLFNTRSGFCEHYAAAFVVLMRGAGIPARVVTGYLGGEINEDYMIVRQSDAHAWAEAFIDGAWRRFDPTGAVAPSRVEHGLAAALPNESYVPRLARDASGWLRNTQLRWDALNHHWQRLVVDFDNDSQDNLWDRLGFPKPALWQTTLAVLLFAGTWCAAVLGIPSLTRSKLATEERLWLKLCQLLSSHGLTRGQSETPSEYLHRSASQWPEQADRFRRLDTHFNALRFQRLEEGEQHNAKKSVQRDYYALSWSLQMGRKTRKPVAGVTR
jgi:transglutaminase-like putative cysteine protease